MRLAAALAGLLLAHAAAVAQSTIELRPSVRVDGASPVRLEDVATLDGPEARALGRTIILAQGEAAGADGTVTLEQVRAVLRDYKPNWGRISLRGGSCRVTRPGATVVAPKPAPSPKPIVDPRGTVREAVSRRVAQIAQAEPADLRFAYAPEDDDFLNMSAAGRTVEIRVTASSERLPLAISVYDGDRILGSRTIRVGVQVRLGRDEWGPLNAVAEEPRPSSPQNKASRPKAAGEPVVKKGDQVTVSCLSGTVVVTTRARAVAPARDGEVVEFESLDASKRRFFARVNGRGRAVINAESGGESAQ